jgi:hypothetical protein
MEFEGNAFISYAHLDNVELIQGRKGWVANLHRALQTRLSQLLGKEAAVWWDPKLQGNDVFAMTLVDRLQHVAALVTVVTPRYVKSEWGHKEIVEFCKAAEYQGGVRVHDKARIFKVLKTPVPYDQHPPELQSLLGYEFFKVDPDTGKVRELDEIFGEDAQRDFWLKLDDLAHDMCGLVQQLESVNAASAATSEPGASAERSAVYLAVTTADLKDQRESIKRDLEQHGHLVLPDRPLPSTSADADAAIRADLARCQMSVHMVGMIYSLVPEGGEQSLIEMQNELALAQSKGGMFSRLVWMPPGLDPKDERQRKLVERLRTDSRHVTGTDLLERPLEDLRTAIDAWFSTDKRPATTGDQPRPAQGPGQLYLIYDKPDKTAVAPFADVLFKDFEVIHPAFDGDEAELREDHEANLQTCDGVLVLFGAGNECWLRRKLREIQKSAGYGRTKPAPVVGICLIPPRTEEKDRLRTHDAIVISQLDGFSPDALQPFTDALKRALSAASGPSAAVHG